MKLVIIGGVAGGASAATRARRLMESAEIVVLQRGPDVSYANCGMPYYIGGEIRERSKLAVQTPESLKQRFRLDVRVQTTVLNINPDTKTLQVKNDVTGEVYAETYDELILAVGAEAARPPIPGIDDCSCLFTLRSLDDMDRIHQYISQLGPKSSAAVIGAGFVGLEMAEQLMRRDIAVTLIERDSQVMAPLDPEMAAYLQDSLKQHGIDVILNDSVVSFVDQSSDHGTKKAEIHLKSGRTVVAGLIIMGIGVTPDTRIILDAGIQCTDRGYIVVDDFLHTSKPNIWAVGDAIRVRNPIIPECNEHWTVPLAGPANRQGRLVADNILLAARRPYKGTYGVAVLRLWDQIAACVGMNEKVLRTKECVKDLTVIHIHPTNHAGYFPGASRLHIKVLFNKMSGKIYGAQAVGGEGVDKRIDVIATAIQGGMTMDSLADLELCYAPPVGSAKDPVNYAGMVAQNIMDGLVSQVEWQDLEARLGCSNNDSMKLLTKFLDVRDPDEIAKSGSLVANAVNIPLDSLRDRIQELDPAMHWIVSCASGQRAYYACRILLQHGFQAVSNLGGAYQTFHSIHPGVCCGEPAPITSSTATQ